MSETTMVKAEVSKGVVIYVEAEALGDPEKQVGIGKLLSFDGLTDSIEALSSKLSGALEKVKPDKATLEFGIDVGVEAGALTGLLAKGSGSATVKITLEWDSTQGQAPK